MILKFSEVLEIKNGKNQKKVENKNGKYPIYGSGGIIGWANEYLCEKENVIIGRKGSINKPIFVDTPFWNVDTAFGLIANREILDSKYLYYFCLSFDFEKLSTTVTIPSLTKNNLLNIKFNVPSLAKQRKIVKKLDKIQEIIKKYQQELIEFEKLSKSIFIEMFGDPIKNEKKWKKEKLDKYITIINGYAFESKKFLSSGIPVLRIANINTGIFKPINIVYWKKDEKLKKYIVYPEDLVITLTGTVGKDDYGNICILDKSYDCYYLNQRNAKLELKNFINKYYLSFLLKIPVIKKKLTNINRGVRQANISNKDILNLDILIPPIELQNQFAEKIKIIEKSKIEIQKSIEETQKLFDSLMEKYFG